MCTHDLLRAGGREGGKQDRDGEVAACTGFSLTWRGALEGRLNCRVCPPFGKMLGAAILPTHVLVMGCRGGLTSKRFLQMLLGSPLEKVAR